MHFTHLPSATNHSDYITRFHRELTRVVSRRNGFDSEDVVQSECVRVVRNVARIAAKYPDPERFARMRAKAAIIDHSRRQKVQRGEGARARIGNDGRVTGGRTVVSGDTRGVDSEFSLFDMLNPEVTDHAEIITNRLAATSMVEAAMLGVSDEERDILYMSYGYEFSDSEIAKKLGRSREGVNRKKNAAVKRIAGELGPDKV